MSISAVGSSLSSCTGYGMGQMTGSSRSERPDADEIAASIFERDDTDGDGLLSLGETPLDEERFNAIDTDGDGFLTEEELAQDAKSREEAMGSLTGQLTLLMQGVDPSEMAASIVENDDTDGDGLLSFEETPLDEDMFNSIDADGDGFISADELSAHMEENMAEGMSMPTAGSEALAASVSGSETEAASASGSTSQSSGSSDSDDSDDYDVYDLNEDGVVSFDELMQAFQNGDDSLKSLFEGMGQGSMSAMRTRMAMEAYEAQMV